MKTAVIFTGQGSQYPGMGKELYNQCSAFAKCIDEASEYAGFDIKNEMLTSDEKRLSDTEIIQPVMAAFAAGIIEELRKTDFSASLTAGLSLGEYCALYFSGVFDRKTLIELTAFRGREMKKCAAGINAKMYAVLGADSDSVEALCKEIKSETGELICISNYNCKGQNVIAGTSLAADLAAERIAGRNLGKCIALKVSAAFHTELMTGASKALKERFKDISFNVMDIPVVFNVTGSVIDETETVKELLIKQVMSPVRMHQSIEYIAKQGTQRIIEVGPGKTIAGFVKRTAPQIEVVSINEPEDFKKLSGDVYEA